MEGKHEATAVILYIISSHIRKKRKNWLETSGGVKSVRWFRALHMLGKGSIGGSTSLR